MEDIIMAVTLIGIGIIGISALVAGAFFLFGMAAEQGFIGLAAFVACWVFFAPVMAVISLLVGFVVLFKMAN